MRISLGAKSDLGKWSAGLGLFTILVFALCYVLAELSNVITSPTLITVAGVASIGASFAAFITGIIAVIKHRERSLSAFLAILLGFVVILMITVTLVNDLLM